MLSSSKQKIVFLGDQSVGKTSIINRFIYDSFEATERPTIGIDFISKTINHMNKSIKLQLWDTAGQERFRSLIPSYIRDSNVAVIVYDITNVNSFQNINKWYEDVKAARGKEVLVVIVGNKADLAENRQVLTTLAEQKTLELEALFFEVSAKNGEGIPNMFNQIATSLPSIDASTLSTPTTNNLNISVPIEKIFDGSERSGAQNEKRSPNIQLKPGEAGQGETKKEGCC